jgi:hypothetical protein
MFFSYFACLLLFEGGTFTSIFKDKSKKEVKKKVDSCLFKICHYKLATLPLTEFLLCETAARYFRRYEEKST